MNIPTRRLDDLSSTINPQRDHEVAAMRDGISNKLRIEQVLALLQSSDIPGEAVTLAKLAEDARAAENHTFDPSGTGLTATDVQGAIEAAVLRGKMLGEPFFLFDNITGVSAPDNSGAAKYIRLTAGQSGAGGYNEGLLTNESVSGSFPLVEATAEIAVGPLAGQIVPLINTEEAVLRARETSGVLQFDQKQRTIGELNRVGPNRVAFFSGGGAFTAVAGSEKPVDQGTGTNISVRGDVTFDSGNSPDARVSSTTSGETRSKNRSATAYMFIGVTP